MHLIAVVVRRNVPLNRGADNMGSTPVTGPEHRAQLQQQFGQAYVRIQTGVHGVGLNRKQRRRQRFKRRDTG